MKKSFIFSLLMALFCAFILSSCNSVAEDPEKEAIPEDYYYGLINSFLDEESNDILLFTDISVDYKDANGEMQTASVTSFPWIAKIEGVTPPFTMLMNVTFTKKEDFTPEKESYIVTFGYEFYSQTALEMGLREFSIADSGDVSAEYLDEYIEILNEDYSEITYVISE